ncbi:MAG: hypothetical protein AB7R55_19140 [Gemmatimonadales bacterium]
MTTTRRAAATLVLLTTLLGGCLDDIDDPDIIEPSDLNTLQGAEALYAGAIGEFALAISGTAGNPGIVGTGGLFTDEFQHSATPPGERALDLRALTEDNTTWVAIYLNLHRAITAAERAADALKVVVASPSAEPRIGELYALSAIAQVMLAEHYCSGLPFSQAEPVLTYGEPLATADVFTRALGRVDSAVTYAAGSAEVADLARVVRGRALVGLDDLPAAAAAVAAVPTGFTYATEHSSASDRQANGVYVVNRELGRITVGSGEGGNGLDFVGAADPRVPTQQLGLGFDGVTPLFALLTLDSRAASVVVASGIEARLIEAEAQLAAGSAAWLATLNDLRQTVAGLDPLVDPGTPAARVELLFRERAFWLFATGHRLGDLRRLIREYGRSASTIFPAGGYHKDNLTYGTDVSIVIPQTERNNPNYTGCDNQAP